MIILETNRLKLRTWQEKDIDRFTEINSDPLAMRYFPALLDWNATKEFVDYIKNHQKKYGYCLYAVELKESGEFIGFVGLKVISFKIPNFKPLSEDVTEIGWRLAPKYWGQGYATEAAKAVLHYGFTVHNLKEIISFTSELNIPSINVMKKIGLKHNSKYDFSHPNLDESHRLSWHVFYRMSKEEYLRVN